MRVGNKIKAVIAIDVLKSDRLDHEPPVDMYYQFLNNHRNFCLHYFQKISDLFPEYLAAFEKIILHPGNTD